MEDSVPAARLLQVPSGEVVLRDRRTERSWTVPVTTLLLAVTPVSQADYQWVTGSDPSEIKGDRLPVHCVSWLDAVDYCNARSALDGLHPCYRIDVDPEVVLWDRHADGYRLPTEAEWEYACRAGTHGPRYGELDDIAWHRGNSGGMPHPVAAKSPNPWGFHDLLGNVWEWVWDVYDPEVYGRYRVLRGGGWSDEHWSCRASVRRRSHPTLAIDDLGFRIARNADVALAAI